MARKIKKNKKAVCLLSGGLDSAVTTAIAKEKKYQLYLLFINYGQKTLKKEIRCFNKLAKYYHAQKTYIVKLPWLKEFGGSALFDSKIKLNQNNLELEYVPFRNSIFLSIATALAETIKAEAIFIGSCGEDSICPDNKPEYLQAFQQVIKTGTMLKKGIKIIAPLSKISKKETVKTGNELKVPFALTWSCHNNDQQACGQCSNCRTRLATFSSLKIKDPIDYSDEK